MDHRVSSFFSLAEYGGILDIGVTPIGPKKSPRLFCRKKKQSSDFDDLGSFLRNIDIYAKST